MTNAFVARMGTNSKLKVFEPAGVDESSPLPLEALPLGIAEHRSVQGTGTIQGFGDAPGVPFVAQRTEPVVYPIVPESDLNGAGLLYFARYVAIMNYGERLLLSDRLERPWSAPLVACLSTERRRFYYFANADATTPCASPLGPLCPCAAAAGAAHPAEAPLPDRPVSRVRRVLMASSWCARP
jgi:probable biosynthetic protein (TIGR04098 family)